MHFWSKIIFVIQLFWMTLVFTAHGQEKDSINTGSIVLKDSISLSQLDSIFNYSDSLSIFNMIDSLMKSQYEAGSSIVIRAGFNSNIIAAGRTIGVNQFGATVGASYYHKSGFYLDLSSYWSQSYNPNLYFSIVSLGYLRFINRHYSVLASYDHLIYNNNDINVENPLTYMVGFSNFLDFRPFTLRLDYAYYFGEQTAHRLSPGVSITVRKYDFIGLDRISFTPTFQVLFGSATITSIQLGQRNQGGNLRRIPTVQQFNENKFGLMNYAFTIPLRITKKSWSFTAAFTYNWPVALPGEESTLPTNSFTALTISKMINFIPRQK